MMLRWFLVLCLTARWILLDAQVLDDFTDGDLNSNPSWFGDTANFEVISGRLWLNGPSQTDTSWITTVIPPPDSARWELSLRLDFNPSASNFLRWYLLATEPDLSVADEGYFFQVGGASNDRISLRHLHSGTESILWESPDDFVDLDTVDLELRVSHNDAFWAIEEFSGGSWIAIGSATDTIKRPFQNTGLWCRYTSTRSDRFSFDDLTFDYSLWVDTVDPFVQHHQLIGAQGLLLEFNEVVTADNIRLRALPSGSWFDAHPDRESGTSFNLSLDEPILEGIAYRIELAEWSDLSGRTLDTNWTILFHRPRLRDIIITEIMPDPSPPVELPNEEYIELYNRSPRTIELESLELWVNDKVFNLAAGQLQPHTFVVIKDHPALPNSGAQIYLKEKSGRLIDAIRYSTSDHSIPYKEEGGWSLVLADTARSCYGNSVWTSSQDPRGGSPGVWEIIQEFPQPQNRWLHYGWYGDTLELRWLQPLDSMYWYMNEPIVLEGFSFQRKLVHPFDRERWVFENDIPEGGLHIFWSKGMRNCTGRYGVPDTLRIFRKELPDSGDIRVSEIMFEPGEANTEWLEVVNTSTKALDVSQVLIGTYVPQFNIVDDVRKPFSASRILNPGERVVWAKEVDPLWSYYSEVDSFRVWETSEWLNLTNDSLSVGIFTEGLLPIETLVYSANFHASFIETTRDVSLERRSLQISANEPSAWHSGPTALEGATPTMPNSHSASTSMTSGSAHPRLFTPNGDGLHDFTVLKWSFPQSGWQARASVVDINGVVIFEHPAAGSTPSSIEWKWTGEHKYGTSASPGVYIWILELVSPDGIEELHRIPVILSF